MSLTDDDDRRAPAARCAAPGRAAARPFTRGFAAHGLAAMGALVELLLPEHCAACGADAAFAPWEPAGPVCGGLRPWDRPHLCAPCAGRLFARPCAGHLEPGDEAGGAGPAAALPVFAAAATTALLVDVVGAWKYHGVRGLGWPLGRALAAVVSPLRRCDPVVLVPVPLHPSRRRRRGFNQAEMLARLAGGAAGIPVDAGVLRRRRATAQQARLVEARSREANLAGAFVALPPQAVRRAVLVDDLVTAGATARSAAAALAAAGWEVAGVAALGLALSRDAGDGAHVDTPDDDL